MVLVEVIAFIFGAITSIAGQDSADATPGYGLGLTKSVK